MIYLLFDIIVEKGGLKITSNLFKILINHAQVDLELEARMLFSFIKNYIKEDKSFENK